MEMIVKNCGSVVHKEVATDDFMAVLRTLVRVCAEIKQEVFASVDEALICRINHWNCLRRRPLLCA